MSRYYRYVCPSCSWTGVRGHNVKVCPQCSDLLQRGAAENMPGALVYLMACPNDTFKIGLTADLPRRLKQLTGYFGGRAPEVLHTIQSDKAEALELELHERFAAKAVHIDRKGHAEFFRLGREDVDYILGL